MKIGIDARLIEETGVGRYIRNLIRELAVRDRKNEYVIFLRKKSFDTFSAPNKRWQKLLADVSWHSVREQLVMPGIFLKEKLDLLHVPYFNIPVFYPGAMIVTIHDLIILHVDTGKASTHPWFFYKLRLLGYRLILWVGLHRVKKIIAVSETTKKDIEDSLGVNPSKIVVTYEGVDEKVKSQKSKVKSEKRIISDPYFLYVGNAYPHKNVEMLLKAFQKFSQGLALQIDARKARPYEIRLVLVGKENYFYKRLPRSEEVIFFGEASETQLANLYQHAKALVFPSLMEGFGLPAIEALSLGCPVICSDIPIFHEILEEKAIYFDPKNPDDLLQELKGNIPRPTPEINKKFDWASMALKTLEMYGNAVLH